MKHFRLSDYVRSRKNIPHSIFPLAANLHIVGLAKQQVFALLPTLRSERRENLFSRPSKQVGKQASPAYQLSSVIRS